MECRIIAPIIANSTEEARKRICGILPFSQYIHLEVMDGRFVKEKSFMRLALDKLPDKHCEGRAMHAVRYEAHLMHSHPERWYLKNREHVGGVIFHCESEAKLDELLARARRDNMTAGIAINPGTDAEAISPYSGSIEKVLVMTARPGRYGSSFLPEMLEKIRRIRRIAPALDIEVDGGITPETLVRCRKAGANQFVVGSYLWNSRDRRKAWNELEREVARAPC